MHDGITSNLPAIIAIVAAVLVTIGSAYWSRVALPRQIDQAYRASLHALAAAVETKDSETVGHARHVADHAVAVAKDMGLPRRELQRIEYAALLRDIGKVNIQHSLLNKTEALSEEEFDRVKSHAKIGADMVSQVPFLERCADIVLHHHERWDGSGYPDGQQGEDISLGARILAVADDYDAITSNRPYHQALSHESAVRAIEDGAGSEYDPAVVSSFLTILERERPDST
ncbi:MAG: HD-GYP domain-containing protein [Armatimonadota bacterium]|nr:HD-GYP domain-containing protein [Armatimonadota bacterium]